MSKIKKSQVIHIAKLAKLELKEEELDEYQNQLDAILDYVGELKEVNTDQVEATSQTTGLENVAEEDLVNEEDCLSQKGATSQASEEHNGYFVVPMVLKERTDY